MIEQKLKQTGLLTEKLSDSSVPVRADLILVFFPTPGIYIKRNLNAPENYKNYPVNFYKASATKLNNEYLFIPAVLASQYEDGMNESGIIYEKDVLIFEPDLIEMLAEQNPKIIEHQS